MKRHARRRDANEPEVVQALERAGWSVQRLDLKGGPDILAGRGDRLMLFEVKSPDGGVDGRSVHRGRGNTLEGPLSGLTPDQREWWAYWKGPLPVIVQTAEEALRAIGVDLERGVGRAVGELKVANDVRPCSVCGATWMPCDPADHLARARSR